jgi:hypothetical protein
LAHGSIQAVDKQKARTPTETQQSTFVVVPTMSDTAVMKVIKALQGDAATRSSRLPHAVEEISALIAAGADVNAAVGPQRSRAIHVAA